MKTKRNMDGKLLPEAKDSINNILEIIKNKLRASKWLLIDLEVSNFQCLFWFFQQPLPVENGNKYSKFDMSKNLSSWEVSLQLA